MKTTRREFLQISGMTVVAAAIPVVLIPSPVAAMPVIPSDGAPVVTMTVINTRAEDRVYVYDADTHEEIFKGVATGNEVSFEYGQTRECVIAIRDPKHKILPFRANMYLKGDTTLAYTRVKDTVLT